MFPAYVMGGINVYYTMFSYLNKLASDEHVLFNCSLSCNLELFTWAYTSIYWSDSESNHISLTCQNMFLCMCTTPQLICESLNVGVFFFSDLGLTGISNTLIWRLLKKKVLRSYSYECSQYKCNYKKKTPIGVAQHMCDPAWFFISYPWVCVQVQHICIHV